MKRAALLAAALLLSLQAAAQLSSAYAQVVTTTARPLLARDGPDATVFRGSLVFFNYCVTCHGPNADGNGRAARLYDPRPANLRASDKNAAYMRLMVRLGGKGMGRSEFMPPWGEELTDEQIGDVVSYLQSINVRHQ
ncbi:cytochrome c [Ramlibacter sp. XY19]|uniref:c-type cytochrome n=1 Tax=Ramlibacter paludis TaxID=2908000 RepID=UPI0023DCA3AC|nr:cytochrome c [Ramlibacter paludis]